MTLATSHLVPGVYFNIDNTRAIDGAVVEPFRTVLIGQMLSTGTATAEEIIPVYGPSDAETKFGVGSMLAEMFAYWFEANSTQEVYAIPMDDAAASTAATYTLTVTAASTQAGTLYLYINDRQFQIGISTGDVQNDIASTIANTINAYPELPVSAAAVTNVVTLTARNKGTVGNNIAPRFNWNDTETFPSGVSVAVAAGVSGATDPSMTDAIAGIPDDIYSLFVAPYYDTTSLAAIKTEIERRFSDTVQLEGHYLTAMEGSTGTVNAVTSVQNSQHISILAAGVDPLTPGYLMAVSTAAQVALSADSDPARPFQTLPLTGCVGDKESNRYNLTEQQSLLTNGGATIYIDSGGVVRIQRLTTTYKTNSLGSPDPSYRDANTMFTVSYFRMSLRSRITTKYPRHKLADDGTSFGPGQAIVTPAILRSEFLDLFRDWERLGLAEGIDQFAADLSVVRHATERNRVDVILPPDLVNQFRILAGSIQFRL